MKFFPSEAESPDTVAGEKASKNAADERCRLQADVTLFFALQEQGGEALQTAVPCEKNPQVFAKVTEKVSHNSDKTLDGTIREMVAGYPVERMVPAIAEYDRGVAALIVGIAKKESDWGRRSPRDMNGDDCFNYWGYKGAGSRGGGVGDGARLFRQSRRSRGGYRRSSLAVSRFAPDERAEKYDYLEMRCQLPRAY